MRNLQESWPIKGENKEIAAKIDVLTIGSDMQTQA